MKKILPLLFISYISCCQATDPVVQEYEDVSVIQLIATPDKFDGKFIRTKGIGRIEFEGTELCISKDDDRYNISKNCLSLELDFKKLQLTHKKISLLNGRYITVEGVFSSKILGHMHMNSGSINQITWIQTITPRTK